MCSAKKTEVISTQLKSSHFLVKNVFFCFFNYLLIVLISLSLIQARENRFFSKFTHFSTTTKNVVQGTSFSPIEPPAPSPADAPATVEASAPAPAPATASTTADDGVFEEEFEGRNNENKEYQSSNYNGYKFSTQSESHETANYNQRNYNDNNRNYYTANYDNNNGYEANQRYGMSDTRFVEGGKYYYDMKNDNNYYYPANAQVSTQNQINNYDNSEYTDTNEFNTMEDENQELYHEANQEEFLP
ncbi:protein E6 [Mercurialis annua]|uniref:protein E6 n=1 Tax=Mercurialis annua TaxID=3986 RepID=UPI0021608FA0|nr:protein E6 [Mercurialis annua]